MCKMTATKDSNLDATKDSSLDNKSTDGTDFEDALQQTGVGIYNRALFVLAVLSLLAAALELFGSGIILTTCKCDLDLDVYKRGLIGSAPMLGVIVSAHLWGYMADTRGRKYTLRLTLLGTMLCTVLSSFANHWMLMLGVKFVAAAFASGTNAVSYAILGEQTPQSHRAKYLLYAATGTMLSQATIALLTFLVMKLMSFSFYLPVLGYYYRPWRLLAAAFGLMNGVIYLLYHVLVQESPKYYFAKGENKKGLDTLKKIFSRNTGKSPDLYAITKINFQEKVVMNDAKTSVVKSMWNQTVPLFDKDNLKNMLLISYLSIVVYSIGPPYLIWLPSILDSYGADLHTTRNFCAMVEKRTEIVMNSTVIDAMPEVCDDSVSNFTLIAMTCFATYLTTLTGVSVVLTKLTGRKWMVIGIHVFGTIMALTLNLVQNVWGIVVFVLSFSCVLSVGIVTAYAVELFPTYLRAMAVCVTMMIGRAFSFILINLIGPQLEQNCHNFFYAMAAFTFSGAVFGFLLPGDKAKNKETSSPTVELYRQNEQV